MLGLKPKPEGASVRVVGRVWVDLDFQNQPFEAMCVHLTLNPKP